MIDVETIFDSDREEYEFMQQKKEQPMNEAKLLPCPFCGGKAHIHQDYTGMYVAQCDKCGNGTLLSDKKTAEMRWNRRTKDD